MSYRCMNEGCKNYYACKQVNERFGVCRCDPKYQSKVNEAHKKELQERKNILKIQGIN